MAISAAPIASGASAAAFATARPMVKTRKNVPMNSTVSLRSMCIAAPWSTAPPGRLTRRVADRVPRPAHVVLRRALGADSQPQHVAVVQARVGDEDLPARIDALEDRLVVGV